MKSTSTLLPPGAGPHAWPFCLTQNADEIAENLIALANSEGGAPGVSASTRRAISGRIYLEDDVEGALQAGLRLCNPPVKTEWQHEQVRGHTVVILHVPRSDHIHTLVDGRMLVRKGAQNAGAAPDDITALRRCSARPANSSCNPFPARRATIWTTRSSPRTWNSASVATPSPGLCQLTGC